MVNKAATIPNTASEWMKKMPLANLSQESFLGASIDTVAFPKEMVASMENINEMMTQRWPRSPRYARMNSIV